MSSRSNLKTATDSVSGDLAALIARAGAQGDERPVDRWNPDYCGEIDMRIGADGTWYYRGSPIGRLPLVKLFASILRREPNGQHVLVTPVEKIGITVDDAPFLAVELAVDGEGETQQLTLRTNVGDVVAVDADHPFRFALEDGTNGFKPYVTVRGRLEALVSRAVMYQMVDLAVDQNGTMGIWSHGTFFAFPPDPQ